MPAVPATWETEMRGLLEPRRLRLQDVQLLILEYAHWSMIDKYQALMDGLTLECLLSFVKEFKSQLFVEGLVQGNVTSTESMDFLKYVVDKLNFMPLEQEMPVQFQVVELPRGHHLCKVKALNKGDANSEVTVYNQEVEVAVSRDHTTALQPGL
ncbi:Nardilysin [Plecturocebus cupreus]